MAIIHGLQYPNLTWIAHFSLGWDKKYLLQHCAVIVMNKMGIPFNVDFLLRIVKVKPDFDKRHCGESDGTCLIPGFFATQNMGMYEKWSVSITQYHEVPQIILPILTWEVIRFSICLLIVYYWRFYDLFYWWLWTNVVSMETLLTPV